MTQRLTLCVLFLCLMCGLAAAQSVGQPQTLPSPTDVINQLSTPVSGRIVQYVILLSLLSLAPGIVMMVTSFTRIIIALSFLRSGLGLMSTPANLIMVSLALFLTFFIMADTFTKAWEEGLKPYTNQAISEDVAYERITEPFRDFMLANVREKDLALFQELAGEAKLGDSMSERDLRILVPAFMTSELRRGFEIGILIILPFLVIDLVVATVTMSMGIMMLPPTVISLPFKVLFFVLIDGWTLLISSLVKSFH